MIKNESYLHITIHNKANKEEFELRKLDKLQLSIKEEIIIPMRVINRRRLWHYDLTSKENIIIKIIVIVCVTFVTCCSNIIMLFNHLLR